MSDSTDDKKTWVTRVLGVGFDSAAPGASAADFPKALRSFQQALDAVDTQIAALQAALRNSGDDELLAIAAFPLNAITGDHRDKVQKALLQIASARDVHRAAGVAIDLIGSFLTHLATDEKIAACDANPFGVGVTMRGTLTPPLETLRAVLQASVG